MKQVSFFLFLFVTPVLLFAQRSSDSNIIKKDSATAGQSSINNKKDSSLISTNGDSAVTSPDSIAAIKIKPDTPLARTDTLGAINHSAAYITRFQKILQANHFLNSSGAPVTMANTVKKTQLSDNFFYLLAGIATLLGFFRFFYTRYFNNLFRVFFNASLRQSQLTDQLLQAKLPSLLFNTLFIVNCGLYVYLLLRYSNWISPDNFWLVLFYCTLSLGIIYLVKFITVKFTGWLTGYKNVTNTYVFVIFLINKILGILLLPFSILIAFAIPAVSTVAVIISLLLIGLMFLLRFFRSYGLLGHQLKISRFHFFMYVVGIELLPVLLIYKGLVLLLGKNL